MLTITSLSQRIRIDCNIVIMYCIFMCAITSYISPDTIHNPKNITSR